MSCNQEDGEKLKGPPSAGDRRPTVVILIAQKADVEAHRRRPVFRSNRERDRPCPRHPNTWKERRSRSPACRSADQGQSQGGPCRETTITPTVPRHARNRRARRRQRDRRTVRTLAQGRAPSHANRFTNHALVDLLAGSTTAVSPARRRAPPSIAMKRTAQARAVRARGRGRGPALRGPPAPPRQPLAWREADFYDESRAAPERTSGLRPSCHGCRRCVILCQGFPALFDRRQLRHHGGGRVAQADYGNVGSSSATCATC